MDTSDEWVREHTQARSTRALGRGLAVGLPSFSVRPERRPGADAGIFVGWGAPVRGREEPGLQVPTEAMEYWRGLQVEGAIESLEGAMLEPHGGLAGFALLRGSAQQLAELRGRGTSSARSPGPA